MKKICEMYYASILHMYHLHYPYLRINSIFEKEAVMVPAVAKQRANYMTHVMTEQCVIIKSSISCQECALLHGRPLCRFYYAGIIAGHPGGEWLMTRAGSLQQCFNSRAIVCHWKIHEEKKEKKASEKQRKKEREKKRIKRLLKVGGIIRPFLKTGKKCLGVSSVGSGVERFFFDVRIAFFERNGVKLGATASVDFIVGNLILRPLLAPRCAIVSLAANMGNSSAELAVFYLPSSWIFFHTSRKFSCFWIV